MSSAKKKRELNRAVKESSAAFEREVEAGMMMYHAREDFIQEVKRFHRICWFIGIIEVSFAFYLFYDYFTLRFGG